LGRGAQPPGNFKFIAFFNLHMIAMPLLQLDPTQGGIFPARLQYSYDYAFPALDGSVSKTHNNLHYHPAQTTRADDVASIGIVGKRWDLVFWKSQLVSRQTHHRMDGVDAASLDGS